jgi:trk system potassium uptake protein TrkH
MAGLRTWWPGRRGVSLDQVPQRPPRLTLHTKLVLITSSVLILGGTLGFFVLESFEPRGTAAVPNAMASASIPGRLLDALFHSVTCRTAGFNTVPTTAEALSPASHFLSSILMFIGGSPASTAGGIKTIGLAVLLLGVWATLRGRKNVEALGRTIPDSTTRRAAVVVILMSALVSVVTLLLCFTEPVSLRAAWFEAVSACGTVGLSTGLTPDLTPVGRLIIMAAMFAGRLGPLTVLIALAGHRPTSSYEYPTEQVGIG